LQILTQIKAIQREEDIQLFLHLQGVARRFDTGSFIHHQY